MTPGHSAHRSSLECVVQLSFLQHHAWHTAGGQLNGYYYLFFWKWPQVIRLDYSPLRVFWCMPLVIPGLQAWGPTVRWAILLLWKDPWMLDLKRDKTFSFPRKKAVCLWGLILCSLFRQSSCVEMLLTPMRIKLVALPELPPNPHQQVAEVHLEPSVRCWGQFGIDLSNCNSWVLSRNSAFQQFIPVIPTFIWISWKYFKKYQSPGPTQTDWLVEVLGVGPTPVFLRTPGLSYEMAQSLPQSLPAVIWFTIVLSPPSRVAGKFAMEFVFFHWSLCHHVFI